MQGPPPGGYGQPQRQQQYQQQQPYGYQQTQQYGYQPMQGGYAFGQCPRCGSPHINYPSFTWWGGLVGPKLLNHASCLSCQFGFNSKTGRSNTKAIAIYMGVLVGISIFVMIFFAMLH